jgi:hypothetical protein
MKRALSSSFVCVDCTKVMHRVRQDLGLVFPLKVQSRILFILSAHHLPCCLGLRAEADQSLVRGLILEALQQYVSFESRW